MLHRTVCDSTLFPLPLGFLEFKASGSKYEIDPCIGVRQIVVSIACMSHEIAELLSTVRADSATSCSFYTAGSASTRRGNGRIW